VPSLRPQRALHRRPPRRHPRHRRSWRL